MTSNCTANQGGGVEYVGTRRRLEGELAQYGSQLWVYAVVISWVIEV